MCQAIKEIREEGLKEGREEGKIFGAISGYRDMRLADVEIVQKLWEKFQLGEEEAKRYLKEAYADA